MKKIVSLVMCCALTAVLAVGCTAQKEENTPQTTDNLQKTAETEPTPTVAPEETEPTATEPAEKSPEENETVVKTNYGEVMGAEQDGVLSYKGIPFAAPPLGELRFAPPQPLEGWDDVLDCTEFRGTAMQAQASQEEGIEYSEDCLYLNIWRTAEEQQEPMPVLVFIHGGAFTQGSPAKTTYDGTRFAQDGVVQVNIAYRLNALGFMPSEEITEEYGNFGNNGVLDQIQALTWVKENIEQFGGDPQNITICGESAGAFSVSNLMLSPKAEGLFQKAIIESGTTVSQAVTAPFCDGTTTQALGNAQRLMDSLNVESIEELRQAGAQEVADASAFSLDMLHPSRQAFFPVFDGDILPEDPLAAIENGAFNKVKLLVGYNTDEGSIFIDESMTEQQYDEFLENLFPKSAGKVQERYPVDEQHTPADRARNIVKMGFRMGGDLFADQLYAAGEDAYLYHFNYSVPALEEAGLGTTHALELLFVFDQFPEGVELDEEARAFVEEVHGRWLNFIKTGDPNEGIDFDTKWESYTPDEKQTMVLNENSHMAAMEEQEDLAFVTEMLWERYE